jgi:hypothetical protein
MRKIYDHQVPISGQIHSCISMNLQDHLILIDSNNIYKYDVKTKKSRTYDEQNVVGAFVIDN